MKKRYIVDANIFLRVFVNDNRQQNKSAINYLSQAQKGKIELLVTSEVLVELVYVLNKTYKFSKSETAKFLRSIVNAKFIEVEKREVWKACLLFFEKYNVDIVDALIYQESLNKNIEVLSFDKDFKKLQK